MKIKKIAIHNIATVTDCVLDMEQAPLRAADLVLICGETGAGKTTILDAICLALYGKAPRMEDTDMVARRGEAAEADTSGLGMDDARQMMTTGTSESWALMSFAVKDGDADRTYTAGWYCSCANGRTFDAFIKGVAGRKGRNSGYRDAANFLVPGDVVTEVGTVAVRDGKDVIDKRVHDEVKRIVGLDFNQFCRTTMLAQGQFSKFYKSSDADKGVILEKILGNNVYSRVGKRVYEKTREYKNVWEQLNDRLGDLKPMTDDERRAVTEAIAEQGVVAASAAAQCHRIDTRLAWLSTDADIKASEAAAATRKKAAEEALTTPEYTAAAAHVALCDDAAAVINVLREVQGNKKRSEDSRKTLEMCVKKLAVASRELREQSSRLEAEKAKLRVNEVDYATRASQREVFDQDKQFVEALNAIVLSDSSMLKYRHALDAKRKSESEAEKRLNEYNDVIRQKSDAIGRIDPLIDTADKVLKTVEDAFALANMAAGKDLDKLRTHLEVGCMCPLCRQKIEHELPQRSDLVDECNALKEQKGSAQKNLDELRDRRNTLVRQKTTAEEMCKQVRYSLEKTKADIETRQKAIDRAVSNLQVETGDIATIDAIIKTLDDEVRCTEETLQSISEAQKQLDALRKEVDCCVTARDKTRERHEQCVNVLTDVRSAIKQIDKALTDAETTKNKAQNTILLIDAEHIFGDIREVSGQVVREAYAAARSADEKQKDLIDSQRHNIELHSRALVEMQKLYAQAKDAMPESMVGEDGIGADAGTQAAADFPTSGDTLTEAVSVDSLNRLMRDIAAAKYALDEIAAKTKSCEAALQDYLGGHDGTSRDELEHLAAADPRETLQMRNIVGKAQRAVGEACARLAEAQHRAVEHAKVEGNVPLTEVEGDEATEAVRLLREAKTEMSQRRDAANGEIGKLNERLKSDDTLHREHQALLERVAQAKTEYDKWARLNSILGDSTGDRFRRIALSFVLESLLERANVYLHKLTPQYDLVGVRGTLNINIRDIGRGGVIRSGNTPSGGETFLVSLALSLALSEISDSLAVDTLFIDEGFGTLSGQPLHNAVELLQSLQRDTCRRVVLISHNASLREMIPVQLQLTKDPYTCTSTVRTVVMS